MKNYLLPLVFVALHVAVFTLFVIPFESMGNAFLPIPHLDKLVHMFLLFPISLVTLLFFAPHIKMTLVGLVLYVIGVEVIQETVIDGRHFEWGDMFFGFLGVYLGLLVFDLIHHRKKQ